MKNLNLIITVVIAIIKIRFDHMLDFRDTLAFYFEEGKISGF